MTYCHNCRSTHLADDARMVGRFTPTPAGFRANYVAETRRLAYKPRRRAK